MENQRIPADDGTVISHYLKSKLRHLDLNALLRKHYCGEEKVIEDPYNSQKAEVKPISKNSTVIMLIVALSLCLFSACENSTSLEPCPAAITDTNYQPEPVKVNLSPKYTWTYDGRTYSVQFHFLKSDYEYYAGKARSYDYEEFAVQDSTHRYLEYVAEQLYSNVKHSNMSDAELAGYVQAFIQNCIIYKETEYALYPVEVLCRGYTDCKGMACTYAAILKCMRIPCVLVLVPRHLTVAVGVPCKGKPYCIFKNRPMYMAELTDRWDLGVVPPETAEAWTVTLLDIRQTTNFSRPSYRHPKTSSKTFWLDLPTLVYPEPSGGHLPGSGDHVQRFHNRSANLFKDRKSKLLNHSNLKIENHD